MKNRPLRYLALLCLFLALGNEQLAQPNTSNILSRKQIYDKYGYDWIDDFSEGLALARKGAGFFVIREDGEKVFDYAYDNKSLTYCEGIAGVRKGGLYGFIDDGGREVATPRFSRVFYIENNMIVASAGGRDGFATRPGFEFRAWPYSGIFTPAGENIIVPKDGKYGLVDQNNNIVISFNYTSMGAYPGGVILAGDVERSGAFNSGGDTLIPFEYSRIGLAPNGQFAVKKGEKWGVVNAENEVVLPFEYDDIDASPHREYVQVGRDGKYAIWTGQLEPLTGFEYKNVRLLSRDILWLKGPGKQEILNLATQEIIACPYASIGKFSEGLAVVQEGNLYGVVNTKLEVVVPFIYNRISNFHDIRAWAVKGTRHILLDRAGAPVTEATYEGSMPFNRGVAPVRAGEQWGLINRMGETVAEPVYSQVRRVDDAGFIVTQDMRQGLLGFSGKYLLPPQYSRIDEVNGFIVAGIENKVGLYTLSGEEVLPAAYDGIGDLGYRYGSGHPGYFLVRKGGLLDTRWDIFNANAPDTLNFRYKAIEPIHDGSMIARIDSLYGVIGPNEEVIVPFIYTLLLNKYNPELLLARKEKCGAIKRTGEIVIPLEYEALEFMNRPLLGAKKDGLWGFIDRSNRGVVPFKYDEVKPFELGHAPVKKNGRWGLVNAEGKETVPLSYDNIGVLNEGIVAVKRGDKWGSVDTLGVEVAGFQYDEPMRFSQGIAKVVQNGRYGIINKKGEVVLPAIFETIRFDFSFTKKPASERYSRTALEKELLGFIVKLEEYEFKMDVDGNCTEGCPPAEALEQFNIPMKK